MRSGSSFVFGVIALVATLFAVPTAWIAANVANEDGYVSFTEALASDGEFRQAVAAYIANDAVERSGLPAASVPTVTKAIEVAASRAANSASFIAAWNETQARSHRLMFDTPGGAGRLTVDLAPLTKYVVSAYASAFPVTITVPDRMLVTVDGGPDQDVIDGLKATPAAAGIGALVALGAAALCLFAARRRSVAVAGLGAGVVVVGFALKLLAGQVVPEVIERTTDTSTLQATIQNLLLDRIADSFDAWLLWLMIAGAIAAVAGIVARPFAGRKTA